jgi:hypothetical protein
MRLRSKRGESREEEGGRKEKHRARILGEEKRSSVLRLWFCLERVIAGKLEFVRCISLGKGVFLFTFAQNLCQR